MISLAFIWITLMASPPLAAYLLRHVTRTDQDRKTLSIRLLCVSSVFILGYLTEISSTVSFINYAFFSVTFFTVAYLLVWFYKGSKGFLNIWAMIIVFTVFAATYLFCLLGMPVMMMVADGTESAHVYQLSDGIVVKQQELGFLDDHSTRYDVYKRYRWLPFICRKLTTKETAPYNKPQIHYDKSKHAVIVSDKQSTDVILIP